MGSEQLDYQEELLRWEKSTQRHKAVKLGDELPETGEDGDLENLYQRLPIQKSWLQKLHYETSSLNDDTWLQTVSAAISELQHAAVEHMCEKSNWTASPDEVYIGSSAVLLQKSSYVSKLLRPEKRLTTKTSFPGQQYVLTVLA